MAQVSYGTITITDTNDIERIYMEYAQSSSNSTAPTTGWSENIPTWEQGKYIWQRTVVKKEGVALSSDSYGDPVCLTGSTGSTGSPGATGRGVSSIVTTYCNYGTGTPAASYSGWGSTVPAYDSTKPNYWIKTVITYTSGTPATDTKIYQDNGITSATATAASAKTQAAAAEGKADSAVSTANNANTNASNALNLANGTSQHFWSLAEDTTTTGGILAAGQYITDILQSNFKQNPNSSGNLLLRSDGVYLNLGLQTLASFTSTALTFNNPSTGQAQLTVGSSGALQSGDFTITNNTNTFSSLGTKIDLTYGEIYTPYFRVSQGSITGGPAAGVYITGNFESTNAKIGGTKQWNIRTFTDSQQATFASITGTNQSFIQLGASNTWLLNTNKIHSAWYVSGNYLAYPSLNSKYYDFGINLPTSLTDKFLYIRYNTSSDLATIYQNDDNWVYSFYIDGSGNIHAPGFYIGDSTTPIGGGVGTVAERLTQGYGSATQPVYFNSNGVPTNTTYTLNAAGAKGVVTDLANNTTSTDLPTAAAVASYVTSRGYITSYTDNKVQTSQANTTKIYLAGTSTTGTSTGTLNFDSNVYLTTTAGVLHATTFEGNLSGTATKANQDGDGNIIKTTYLKLTGGNVTGAVTFGSSVSVDELTAGDLVVNGNASFTNSAQFNTINGVAVGNSPKFTDTTYSSLSAASGGTAVSLVTTGEKYTWNNKQDKLTNPVTGTGTSGYLAKWNGSSTVTTGPALGTDTTKFLNNKGEWAVPAGTYTYTLPLAASGVRGGVQIGYSANGKNYPVQLDSEKMYVNVPWTDNNTTYTIATGDSNGQIKVTPSSGNAYNVSVKGWTSWLPLAGGTMTGGITFNKVNNAISYTGSQATYAMIKFKDNTSDTYGNGIVIGGGGLTVIGGGESADTIAAQYSSGGDESMLIGSDGGVIVMTNVQDGYANRKTFSFGTDGTFNAPTNITINGVSVLTSHQDISGKADKSTTVTNVAYSSKKITKTINGTTSDVVTAATLKTDMALNNVTNNAQVKGLSSGTTSGHLVTWGADGYTVADSGITKSDVVKSVGSNNSGQLVLTYADDTTSDPIDVTFVATIASSATLADALNVNGTAVGSATVPVYFDNQGKPQTSNTIPKLNNTTTGGTFYAPTSAGTAKQILVSTAGTPGWQTVATGGTNGTIKIGSDEYAVKGLAAAAYKGVADSSSASAIGTGTSVTTERDVYYGLPTINNAHNYTSSTTIYAPTAGGTSSQVLVGNGTTSAPTWKAISDLVPSSATNATNDSDGNPINTTYIKKSIGTAAGDIIYWSANGTPTRLAKGSNGQFLTLNNGIPAWSSTLVTGVKGNSESSYRTGQVNITATNIGLGNVENKSSATIRSELTDSNVTTALGYTPSHNVSLGFHNDYDRCVIALCETTATNTGINSWSNGVLTRQRDNGLVPTKVAYVTFNGAYSTAYSAHYSLLCNHENTSTDVRGTTEGFRACTFTYNSKRYAGLEFYQVQASTFFYTQLAGTFTPFMVPYYNTNSSTVKNSEINNSLVYDTSTLFRQPFDAQTITGHTVGIDVPSTAKFTDTWNALSTSQAGYVSTAPNDTTKFLRGDAQWAQVSSANLSDIRLTWNSSVSTTDWILAHDTAATGTPLFRAMSPANLKTTMSLNNVENKSSATIRGELTSSNVTTALGYTPVNKAGDSMSGGLAINASNSYSSYNEGLRINAGARTYATLLMGGTNGTTNGVNDGAFWIGVYNTGSYARRLMIAHNGSTATNTYFYSNAAGTVSPWLHLGNSGTITNGNADAVSGGVVYTAISNLNGTYVSLSGNEGILGTKVFDSGTSYGSVSSKTSYTAKANINYNSTLDALVFSFA